MKGWLGVGIVICVMGMIAPAASAQFLPWVSEITGFGGVMIGGDDLPVGGVAMCLNLSSQFGAEGELAFLMDNGDIDTINVNMDLVLNLGTGSSLLVPYLIAGAGVFDNGGTHIAINGGAGAKVFVEPNLALRFDFRVFLMSEDDELDDIERAYGGIDFVF